MKSNFSFRFSVAAFPVLISTIFVRRYRGRREESPRLDRGRGDEWADPWMRTKSPASGRRRRRRKNTYSSGSSYSSSRYELENNIGLARIRGCWRTKTHLSPCVVCCSESSRSSSRSSLSSRSHQSRSRSKGRSSGSGTHSSSRSAPETQAGKKPPMQFKLSPSSRQQLSVSKKSRIGFFKRAHEVYLLKNVLNIFPLDWFDRS